MFCTKHAIAAVPRMAETLLARECLDNLNVNLSSPRAFRAGDNARRCFTQQEFSQGNRMATRRADVRTFPMILFPRLRCCESHNWVSVGSMTERGVPLPVGRMC
jgi:hypothetical protein